MEGMWMDFPWTENGGRKGGWIRTCAWSRALLKGGRNIYDGHSFENEGYCSERGVYGLTRIFTHLSTYHSVLVYVHSVDA
jgi:hypothetical protein